MSKKIIIIGAGFGGLSAAALLAQQGHSVTVLEKNDQPGGRARMMHADGYAFDMGPSWYLMPDVFERFFSHFNTTPASYYTLSRLDPSYRIFFGGESVVDIHASLEKNIELFEQLEPQGGKLFFKYLKESERQYTIAMNEFVYRNYTRLRDMFDWRLITEGIKLKLFSSFDAYTKKFFTSEKARKILEYTIVFLGGTPSNTPALYSIMSHVDFNLGVWYPQGGLHAVAQGMYRLAQEQGAQFIFNTPVTRIMINEAGNATGVETPHGIYEADIVVVNADYHHAETQLLNTQHQSYPQHYWDKATIAPSGFIMYLGINKELPQLQHHNLFLDTNWVEHFETIFKKPSWPDNPSYYICNPSKTDSTVAPQGKENLFILVPVASGLEDTAAIREEYKNKILTHLEKITNTSIISHIEHCTLFAHNDFTQLYNSFKGTALGLSHTLNQTAYFRPHNKSKKVSNLYYTGQYVHPGVGVPMTLISSELMVKRLLNEQ